MRRKEYDKQIKRAAGKCKALILYLFMSAEIQSSCCELCLWNINREISKKTEGRCDSVPSLNRLKRHTYDIYYISF